MLLVHAYYIVGIKTFGDFILDEKGPWCVEVPLGLNRLTSEVDGYYRSLRIQEIMGGRYLMCFKSKTHIHNHGYLSSHNVRNSAVWSVLLGRATGSPCIEFLLRFYAWRIYQCAYLDISP